MSKTKKTLEKFRTLKYRMIFEGIFVGIITGFVVSMFRLAIEKGEAFRHTLSASLGTSFTANVYFLAFIIISTAVVYGAVKLEPYSSGSGIPQVKGEIHGMLSQNWGRVLLSKLIGATMAISAGLSLGREGPSIQLGAMVGKGVSTLTKKLPVEEKLLITCGAGAGLAGAFCAPLAGVVFALEELHKNFSTEILLSTMAASIMANFVASSIFGLEPVFDIVVKETFPLSLYGLIIIFGITLGLIGKVYNSLMLKALDLYEIITSKFLRVSIAMASGLVLTFVLPTALGSGHFLVSEIAKGGKLPYLGLFDKFLYLDNGISSLDPMILALITFFVIFVAKILFSAISFGSGVPGGIFLPLLVLGAIAGGAFYSGIGIFYGGASDLLANFVIIGMTGLFASIVRAPITGVILITEMTGDFRNFLPLALVALVSYVVADMSGASPIYDSLLDRSRSGREISDVTKSRISKKVLLEGDVYFGSIMDGKDIESMQLPKGTLIISVQRAGKEIVPSGATILRGGDKIVVLCAEDFQSQVANLVDNLCKRID